MERPDYLNALDDYFCARYSDYVKISAIEGFEMPEILFIAKDGNVARRDSSCMRLNHQKNAEELLARFKAGLVDTDFTFSFSFRPLKNKLCDPFRKETFAKCLPAVLAHCNETAASAGEKLAIEPRFWQGIAKGKLYPQKSTVLALALVTHMQTADMLHLLTLCGFSFEPTNVRDVVIEYLLVQKIFNPEMRDACLKEYRIENLPIRR